MRILLLNFAVLVFFALNSRAGQLTPPSPKPAEGERRGEVQTVIFLRHFIPLKY